MSSSAETIKTKLREQIINAVKRQDINTVKNLLKQGAEQNVTYYYDFLYTALHHADMQGNKEFITLVFEFCAEHEIHLRFFMGYKEQNIECMKILFKYQALVPIGLFYDNARLIYGPDEEQPDEAITAYLYNHVSLTDRLTSIDGFNAFHIAVQSRNLRGIEILLKRGANVNERTFNGKTALHIGVNQLHIGEKKRLETIKKLLEYGAQPDLTNNQGLTPLHVLEFYWKPDPVYRREVTIFMAQSLGADPAIFLQDYDEGLHVSRILTEEIARIQYTGKHVCEKLIELIETSEILNDHYQKCNEELQRIKIEIVSENVMLCEFLNYSKRLSLRAKNPKIVAAFRDQQYERQFPIFFTILNRNFQAALNECTLMYRAALGLSSIIKWPLIPSNVIETIVEFLSVDDLNKLAEM